MDSLFANYASSDEEEQDVPAPQQLKPAAKPLKLKSEVKEEGFNSKSTSNRGGILNSLPPPKSSLFNSLPPPKSQSFPNPNLEQPRDEQILETSKPKTSSFSLFSSLPLPSASSSSSNNSRKVVQFKPPTILNPYSSKIDDEDDEDDEGEKETQRKRLKESLSTSSASSFLSSIPAPRYSSSLGTLGTGRKSMFQTVAPASTETETVVSATQSNAVGSADASMAQNNGGVNSNVVVSEVQSGEISHDYRAAYGLNVGSGDVDYMYGNGQHVEYSNAGDNYVDYGNNVQYENNWANETAQPEVSAVVSELRVPGKRGRKDAPLEIVEVKQDELMKNRPRQDQVKATGIAFGPAYQPTSSKGKPTKLHKRKHQIGSLYFDLKQKETELAERRSQGFQTKAQTQAKYGW